MRDKFSLSSLVRSLLFAAFLLCAVGLGGLYWLMMFTLPTLGPRWLFFFFLVCLGAGLAMPLMLVFNYPALPRVADPYALVVREAIWVGVYLALLAWLQLSRLLSAGIAVLLALGLLGVEVLWRLRDRSRQPPERRPSPQR